jgi:hypothetical protein
MGTRKKRLRTNSLISRPEITCITIVDITGLRPNCFIELGYGLGRGNRVIVTAKSGTTLPFDQQAISLFLLVPW